MSNATNDLKYAPGGMQDSLKPFGEAALQAVRGRGLEPMTALVRRSTLEDVFLTLTGRTLVD